MEGGWAYMFRNKQRKPLNDTIHPDIHGSYINIYLYNTPLVNNNRKLSFEELKYVKFLEKNGKYDIICMYKKYLINLYNILEQEYVTDFEHY